MRWSLSQNCSTRPSKRRAKTGRVGLLQSDGKMGSHTTRTARLSDFSCFSTSSAAEAPRKQPGQVGEKRSTILTFVLARLNSVTNGLSLVRRVSGGCPLGVIADHKKYQHAASTRPTPRNHATYLVFAICDAPSSLQAGWQGSGETRSPVPPQQPPSRKEPGLSCSV